MDALTHVDLPIEMYRMQLVAGCLNAHPPVRGAADALSNQASGLGKNKNHAKLDKGSSMAGIAPRSTYQGFGIGSLEAHGMSNELHAACGRKTEGGAVFCFCANLAPYLWQVFLSPCLFLHSLLHGL